MRRGLLCLLLLTFGLSFGLNYGTSNECVYLLESLKAIHPNLWTRDWAVTQNHAYHPAYARLGELLLRISPTGYAIGGANVACIALAMFVVYALLRRLAAPERALPALCIVLLLASVTRTQAAGGSYAFSEIFQPSTLGSLGFIAAALAFAAGRPLLSGLALAFGGLFHVNYLVLGLCVFGVAWLCTGRERLVSRALAGLGPPFLVLLYFLPFLLASANPTVSAEARRIYLDLRSPHHYRPVVFAWDFSFFAGFQLLGVAALSGPARRGLLVQRRILFLLVGCWALVIPAALLSSVVVVRFVQQLFAWRICPQADLLAQAAFAAGLVSIFCDGRPALASFDRLGRWLAGLGVAALVLGSVVTGKWNATLVVLCLLLAAFVIASGFLRRLGRPGRGALSVAVASAALLTALVAANIWRFAHLVRTSNLLSGVDPGVAELCAWEAAHTAQEALFLTPPQEDELRLRCQRAIVVDWKSNPAVPSEVLEWYKRIEDVTGRRPFRREADLDGYQELDASRVASLRQRYGIDYVVVERGHEISGLGVGPAFTGSRFVAYALPPPPK
jgi:uncharacterized protein DUF6798